MFHQNDNQNDNNDTLNIHLYRNEAQQIIMRLDLFTNKSRLGEPINLHEPYVSKEWHVKTDTYLGPILDTILPLTPQVQCHIKKTTETLQNLMRKYSCEYVLSTSPQVILNWIGCFINYFMDNPYNLSEISIIQGEIADNNNIAENIKCDVFNHFLKNILLLKNDDPEDIYKYAIEALEKIYHISSTTPPSRFFNYDYILVNERCQILFPGVIDKIHNNEISTKEKEQFLLSLGKQLIHQDQKTEFSFLLRSLNYLGLKSLYNQVLGKLDIHDYKYSFRHTEWKLLAHSETYLRKDGCISIINLANNKGYINWYAPEKSYHGRLKDELVYLCKLLSIELHPDTDYETEIIFTRASSQNVLIPLGLGITEKRIKELMYESHLWRLFGNDRVKNIPTEHSGPHMMDLPEEMRADIINFAKSKFNHK